MAKIICGDCRDVVSTLEPADAVVTDPPYGLSFMGKGWDKGVPGVEFWTAIMGAMKPGAHLLAFGGTRTYHRLTCAIEDAGFEIRDCLMWIYGSGFPKSHDVSKAIDKAAGVERERTGRILSTTGNRKNGSNALAQSGLGAVDVGVQPHFETAPATHDAKKWQGYGTALKPAYEPIIMARKPIDGTIANNVLKHGCGAINVDGCRVGSCGGTRRGSQTDCMRRPGTSFECRSWGTDQLNSGRFPANLIHDGSDEATAGMGEASRYFYCPKASKKDRGDNNHPTIKPTDLMAYLCRLVTPPGGTILDPFNGSGSTGKAAVREGFNYIGCELNEEYVYISRTRIKGEIAIFAKGCK